MDTRTMKTIEKKSEIVLIIDLDCDILASATLSRGWKDQQILRRKE